MRFWLRCHINNNFSSLFTFTSSFWMMMEIFIMCKLLSTKALYTIFATFLFFGHMWLTVCVCIVRLERGTLWLFIVYTSSNFQNNKHYITATDFMRHIHFHHMFILLKITIHVSRMILFSVWFSVCVCSARTCVYYTNIQYTYTLWSAVVYIVLVPQLLHFYYCCSWCFCCCDGFCLLVLDWCVIYV